MIGFLTLIHYLLNIYIWLIIARVLLSWLNPDPYNQLVRWLCRLTDPLLFQIRRTIPMPRAGLDFSPIIALLFITFFPQLIVGPIVHHSEMVPQFESKDNLKINYKNIAIIA